MLQLPTHSEAKERKSLLAKRNNAAARGLVPSKDENEKKSGHMIKCLLTEWGRAGRENMWLSVRTSWPRVKYFPARPSHSVNKYITSFFIFCHFKTEDQLPPDFMSQYTGKLELSPKGENKICSELSTTDIHQDVLPQLHVLTAKYSKAYLYLLKVYFLTYYCKCLFWWSCCYISYERLFTCISWRMKELKRYIYKLGILVDQSFFLFV